MQGLPLGPLMLRDFGLRMTKSAQAQDHRGDPARPIRSCEFVLIGDSGEQDPEIYAEIVRRFPDRVRAIYITVH